MPDLLGIIVPLKKFLSNTDEAVTINFEHSPKTILSLTAERTYNIPDFQREIRWTTDNISVLIEDLKSRTKFLGNVILTKHSEKEYSIIDGQQRITILTMILNCIKLLHENEINTIVPCRITIDSLSQFSKLMEEYFPREKESDPLVIESDKLNQVQKYYRLWDYIINLEEIKNKKQAQTLINNLGTSTFNIVINESDDVSTGIEYFIDVNLKGKQLDTEDIFKSYLFRNDSSKEIRSEWYNLKTNVANIQPTKMDYDLLKLLEHYFLCDLYLNDTYKGIEFGTDFLLNKSHKDSSSDYTYRKGTHIIEVINNNRYMHTSLHRLNKVISIMLDIVTNDSTTDKFKKMLSYTDKNGTTKELDDKELKIIHNIMAKILKDSLIPPKALVMKYILLVLLSSKSRTKDDIRKIYAVYMVKVLFSLFEPKKKTDALMTVLKSNSDTWYQEMMRQISGYFEVSKITDARLLAQYNLGRNEAEEDWKFRCKSLATIYNFFEIKNNKVTIKALSQLYKFIADETAFSLEHFIISNTKTHTIKSSTHFQDYIIDAAIYKKYVNNLFNFIFIPEDINSELANFWLPDKIRILKTKNIPITCEYSKMVIENLEVLNKEFEERIHDNYKDSLDLFFARDFKDMYIDYAKNVLKSIIAKIASYTK